MSCLIEEIFYLKDIGMLQLAVIKQNDMRNRPYFDSNIWNSIMSSSLFSVSLTSSSTYTDDSYLYLHWEQDWLYLLSYELYQSPMDPSDRIYAELDRMLNECVVISSAINPRWSKPKCFGRFHWSNPSRSDVDSCCFPL